MDAIDRDELLVCAVVVDVDTRDARTSCAFPRADDLMSYKSYSVAGANR